ncbi:MAG: GNAT family N-acetyltransferase [Bacilli bacterium]|nr:GNAT family N-acetyltransferase [Bacilli bacterium]
MIYKKLSPFLEEKHFYEMWEMEQNCGLEPYSVEMLLYCLRWYENYGCFENDKLIGFITVDANSIRYPNADYYIVNLNVHQDYRRKLVATSLIYKFCEEHCHNLENVIILDVFKENKAVKLYSKLGFDVINIDSKNGPNDIVMATTIKNIMDKH